MWESHKTRADLLADGLSAREITAAVRSGALIRARRGCYLPPDAPDDVVRAVRVGGRLTCLSLLQLLGVFVLANSRLHVHLFPDATRMRTPHDRKKRLRPWRAPATRLHWHTLADSPGAATCADVVVALANAVLCQAPRAAIASIDSALNMELINLEQVDSVFDLLPAKYGVLRPLVDGQAQSGPETMVRIMLLGLGCSVRLQVEFEDVGFVDLVADDWLVVECDSKKFHSDWVQQLKDYRRDLALARAGYVVLRLAAEDIMYRPDEVVAALRGVLTARRER
ncbi:DUF559 domain-containing protein [Microbacterium sp. CFH 90308]|uniref:DUF559 domain-containing protein n=1 Tax=Microbacterium salsuginis TaxID=2722803 RepID=A0ABX1KD56_9MICO|nr:type IV toxin-antitoxin system AbiEi family antitoxin domain-containing protein [Microbacterium sp. CFH 90308]NLP83994.1 DUF559 domain-containing protein [Microbacterium sp. CFH 90308]